MMGCLVLAAGCGTQPSGRAASQPPATGTASPGTASTEVPSPQAPGTPVSSAPVSRVPEAAKPKPVKPTGDAVNPRKVRWTKAERLAGGRQVRLVWWSGVEPCTVLDRVRVKETGGRVTITLYEGASPKARNVSCVMIAVEKSTTVKLKSPVGKRKIVDGARS